MDAFKFLSKLEDEIADLVYLDPPFNTNLIRSLNGNSYVDKFKSYDEYKYFICTILDHVSRIMKPEGSLFFHIDYRESHYCKIWLDSIFGRGNFVNEIVWAYDYGARSKVRYSPKHDSIFWYSKTPKKYKFNFDEIDRIPYMSPGLVGKEKVARGKTINDVWWHTIVPTRSKERVGYPTQKPLGILERIVKIHSDMDDLLIDPMCGSGTFGVAAKNFSRNFILNDENIDAVKISRRRLGKYNLDEIFEEEGDEDSDN
jgi:site-specific DNA-methyltransferase (adenine-specific)